jgi:hypothetical protein
LHSDYTCPREFREREPVYLYWDRVVLYLKRELRRHQIRTLSQHCRSLYRVAEPPADRHYRVCWILAQPGDESFRYLERELSGGYMIVGVEPAMDFIVRTQKEADEMDAYLDQHQTHPREPMSADPGVIGTVRHSNNQRYARRRLSSYTDRECRLTGELYCVHREWQFKYAAGVRSLGINSATDLLTFDFAEFWRHHLDLKAVDRERLGRYLLKHGLSRDGGWIEDPQKRHRYIAGIFVHRLRVGREEGYKPTVRDIIRACRRYKIRRDSFLTPIDNFSYLPRHSS